MEQPAKILIVDDDRISITVLSKFLTFHGFELLMATHGSEVLPLLHEKAKVIDLILLDVIMPDASGIDILKMIRERWDALSLPVIMVTGRNEGADISEALRYGASDYITKPINFEIAIARIRTQIKLIQLYRKLSQARELETIHALVATMNHEIRNPLFIADSFLRKALEAEEEEKISNDLNKVKEALVRISEMVKRIESLTEEKIEYASYAESTKMLKLK